MAAIFDIHGYNVSPITAATIKSKNDKISSTIASIIDLYNDYINPRRYADELPEDLWIQIFVRLSVKPLLRLMCVCKHWYVLVKDPRFTRKHLQFQKTISENMGHFLFLHEYQHDCVFNYFAFDGESVTNAAKSLLSLPSYHNLFHFSQEEFRNPFKIDGPINGLYCLHNGAGRIVIWNPATKEVGFLPLPDPYLPCNPYLSGDKERYLYDGTIGFGTDPLDEEHYKVILLTRCFFSVYHKDESYVMLYTTKTNIWRHIKFVGRPVESLNNTYLNGSYYWISGRVLLEFDMSKETFRYTSAPSDGKLAWHNNRKLALHNNRITLFDTNVYLNEIDIWVMLEESNWLKLKKICVRGIQGRVVKTLGFWKTENDLLIVVDDDDSFLRTQTVVYNTTTLGIMNIGPKGNSGGFKACVYYESLVSLSGEIVKYNGNDNVSLFDTICGFLLEDLSDDDEDEDITCND